MTQKSSLPIKMRRSCFDAVLTVVLHRSLNSIAGEQILYTTTGAKLIRLGCSDSNLHSSLSLSRIRIHHHTGSGKSAYMGAKVDWIDISVRRKPVSHVVSSGTTSVPIHIQGILRLSLKENHSCLTLIFRREFSCICRIQF